MEQIPPPTPTQQEPHLPPVQYREVPAGSGSASPYSQDPDNGGPTPPV